MPLALPRLYVKPGVDLNGLSPGGARILAVVAVAPLILGFDITISCGKEGHREADPHTHGDALDLRTRDLTPAQIVALYKYSGGQLGPLFTVLYEVPLIERASLDPILLDYVYLPSEPDAQHLHLQVKKGQPFPPSPQSV